MVDTSELLEALHGIADRMDGDMSEKDVENAFLNENYYSILGYEGAGYDLRSEWTLPDNKRPDYVTLNSNESVTAVYEFKSTGRDLSQHESQLFNYVDELKSDYGILTNGEELRLYKRQGHTRIAGFSLGEASETDAADLASALRKPEWDITNPQSVNDYIGSLDQVELDGELGQEHFFDTFRLEEGSPFANLVVGLMDLLTELRDEQEAKFVKGAYDFWEASYASEPDETPDSWEPFIDGDQSLRDFMFCLESGHALLSRLLLAKATDDHDFFPTNKGLSRYFNELGGFNDNIELDAYPIAANGMIEDMRNQLVQSLFEDDIFIWWIDGYGKETASLHKNPYNRFKDVAKEGSEVDRVSPATRERFSRSIAQVSFAVLKFDFSRIEGDPLGDLYQRYFDPETRKALGEFYTPQPVIDYIMDGVDYDVGVSQERLIDPSCGSGTFLVEALNRYLDDVRRYDDDPDWAEAITELCTRPHIVGLDIHPFAVLMAQIRFMITILPEYRQAKRENSDFTIRRLPIFRTDSLRNERELTGIDLGDDSQTQMTFDSITEDNQDVRIPVPLPIEVDEGEVADSDIEDGFLVQRVRMPKYETAKVNAEVRNFGEYFAALQGVLDVVKYHMREGMWEYRGGLNEGIHRYTTQEYDDVEDFFEPYVNDVLGTVRYLREDHGDGRLFKMFEDTVLALVVKNYMEYDYVVGNPPYVSSQNLPHKQKEMLDILYPDSATDQYDLYCPFFERGLDWLVDSGKLGYITPNQFMVANYGRGIRQVIQENTIINQIQDFRDSGVFKDATNYPLITILQLENDEETRNDNIIRCGRVKSNIEKETGRELDDDIVDTIRTQYNNPGYSSDYIDIFDYPQTRLSETRWPIMPQYEWDIFKKIESTGDETIGNVTDAVFQGIMTGKKGFYIVEVLDADIVTSSDSGDTVTILPTGSNQEYKIETDLLRPFIDGKEVERWQISWEGLHIVHPYRMKETNDGSMSSMLIDEETLASEVPLTMDYFEEYREELSNRSSLGDKEWYEYSRPQNLEKFERPKIILSKIASEATYMSDTEGTWYFTTPYSVLLDDERAEITEEMTAQLNSKVLDFYFKHISAIKAGGFYEYLNQYITPVPCKVRDSDAEFSRMKEAVQNILSTLHLGNKTERFPEAYLGEFDGDLGYIDYEWQTRRYPVNADIQELTDGRFAVTAGRSDEITDPLIDSGDREEQKLRAEYIHTAVDGRNMKSGEEQTIPIPQSREGVEQLMDSLREDQRTVEETSIDDLEAEIDEAVYDLFELTEDEREVVEEYLEVF